ncbi:Wzz/FepE/Etk N-terminal domain-containing protein [Aeromonas simiae]|uniref:Wzz/FepE/Etk N-terminal domain-containing protein n=1 Tax=Aeromonas simiae TaxID=218936 RepID=UPI0038CF2DAD
MMTITQFFSVLLARRRLLLLVALTVLVLVLAMTLLLPKRYMSEAVIAVDGGSDPVQFSSLGPVVQQNYLGTQVAIVASHATALRVVRDLRLADYPQAQERFARSGEGGDIASWLAAGLLRDLDVVPGKESNTITVRYGAVDPAFAAAIANGFVDAYRHVVIENRSGQALQSESFFKDQMVDLQRDLEQRQARLSDYQRQHGILAGSRDRIDTESQRLMELTGQVTQAEADYIAASSRVTDAQNNDNPLLAQLTLALADLRKQRSLVAERSGTRHPQYQQLNAQIAATERERADQQGRIEAQRRQSVEAMAARLKAQQDELAEQKQRVLALKDRLAELDILQRGVDNAQRSYELVMQKWSEAAIQSNASLTNITVLQRAQPSARPVSPRPLFNLLFGTLLALGCGALASFLVELRARRVRCADDLTHTLGLPVLITLQGERSPARAPRLLLNWRGGQS